jgi:CDP-glucose 4,6-dehydratase
MSKPRVELIDNQMVAERSDDSMDPLVGKSVFLTGHTGFKGSWLTQWLHHLGARVTGYALDPPSQPSHFDVAHTADLLQRDVRGDIRDSTRLAEAVRSCAPDVVFHLAAQPIVRASLEAPRETFDVNVVGTASVLDAIRSADKPCAVIVVTSDKCYRNDGQNLGFREDDPLGGHDPYSASKAGTELVVEAYRSSYFPSHRFDEHGVQLASVRAGNVIGGGDWAADRIVPDAVRALSEGKDLIVRNPQSTRPWQHVLEPLSGYLLLASRLLGDAGSGVLDQAWNFGPLAESEASVEDLATAIVHAWGSGKWVSDQVDPNDVEAATLRIAIDKAMNQLGWRPRWGFDETVNRTVNWYRAFYRGDGPDAHRLSLSDIESYEGARL